MSEQLALDLDPDRWIFEALDDLLLPGEPVEPDSAEQRAEIAARMDEHDRIMLARREREMARPVRSQAYVPLNLPMPPAWRKIYKRLGRDV